MFIIRTQPFSQKIVQARMWAQGLTIGVLIAAGMIAHSNRSRGIVHEKHKVDHSWRDIIALQEAESKKAQLPH
jgi:hypothetical protein